MKTLRNLILALAVAFPLAVTAADVGGTIAWQSGTNIIAACTTNTPATITFTNIFLNADEQSDICIAASAKIVGIGAQATGPIKFSFAKGDGSIYELTSPGLVLVSNNALTNTTAVGITNFALGGIPKLKLLSVDYTSTNAYATNIVLRYYRKAIAQRWRQ